MQKFQINTTLKAIANTQKTQRVKSKNKVATNYYDIKKLQKWPSDHVGQLVLGIGLC